MKKVFVKDIKQGERISDTFLVVKKETGVSKSGKPYLNLRLCDRTGEIEARVWEDADAIGANFQAEDVVVAGGFAVSYRGVVQLNISEVTKSAPGEYAIRDYLPASVREPSEMMAELDAVVSGINDPHLKGLLTGIFSEGDMRERFMLAPAAKAMHHPYIGGLIEHVLSLCALSGMVSAHYPALNRDLLTAGLILHDIGKVYELSYDRAIGYTDEGRLIGHITLGVELVDGHIRKTPGFPDKLAMLLKHMLLSHHGCLEFGSPKRPKTLEAVVLHYLDDMDAKINAVLALMAGDAGQGEWSEYQRLLERYIYKGRYVPEEAGEKGRGRRGGGKDDDAARANDDLDLFGKP